MTPYFVKPVIGPDGSPMLVEIPLPINNRYYDSIVHALGDRSDPQHGMVWGAILDFIEEQTDRFVEDLSA